MSNAFHTANKTNRINLINLTIYVCFCFIIISITPSLAVADEIYRFERLWPVLPQPWYFNKPEGVTIDNSGNIYVADTGNSRILKFTADGFLISIIKYFGNPADHFDAPIGIAIDTFNNIYVADAYSDPTYNDQGHDRIVKFHANGEYIKCWTGSNTGRFYSLCGIATDDSNNLYITDSIRNRKGLLR